MLTLSLFDILLLGLVAGLGVFLIALGLRFRRAAKAGRKPSAAPVLVLSAVAIVVSGWLIWQEVEKNRPHRYDPTADQALGRMLAGVFIPEQTQEGDVVVLSLGVPDNALGYNNLVSKTRLKAFLEAMAEVGHPSPTVLSLLEIQRLVFDGSPEDDIYMAVDFWHGEGGYPAAILQRVWQDHPDVKIVVSMDGLPAIWLDGLDVAKPEGSRLYALGVSGYMIEMIAGSFEPFDGIVIHRDSAYGLPNSFSSKQIADSDYLLLRVVASE